MSLDETNKNYSFKLKQILSVWIGALILCVPALLNNFPFLYADSGTYLYCGFLGQVSEIRPITYGLFLRHVSLFESLWLVVFVQGLIVSWTIHAFFKIFSNQMTPVIPLLSVTVLTLMTGIGEVTGMLMPDFFTPVMILCSIMLLYGENITWWRRIVISLLLWAAVASHHSNAYTLIIVLLAFFIIRLIQYRKTERVLFLTRRFILVFCLTIAGYFTIGFIHWSYSGDFYWSKAKSVFITNRINEMGLLKPFLERNCPNHSYRLCASKDEIPFDFLWDSNSPLNKSGGMGANDEEYGKMLKDFFSQPYFFRKFLVKTFENGVLQFFTIEGKVIFKEREEGYPYQVFQQVWPEEIPAIRRSLQYEDQWDSTLTQYFQRFLVYGSFLYLIWTLMFRRSKNFTRTHRNIIMFIMFALLANAFICGGISMIDVRFQYRVIWLIPLSAILIVGDHASTIWNNLKSILGKNGF